MFFLYGKIMRRKFRNAYFQWLVNLSHLITSVGQIGYEIITVAKWQNQKLIQQVPVSSLVPPSTNCHFLSLAGGWIWRFIWQVMEIVAHRTNWGPCSSGLLMMPRTVQFKYKSMPESIFFCLFPCRLGLFFLYSKQCLSNPQIKQVLEQWKWFLHNNFWWKLKP